ncbi:hypothetical protein NE237_010489 [Protea cynaroides]|uniref:Lipoxygenase domain-containing protein n=1 Tax=Protea cynaroides TaxID=273540 RepID=A0A9Q0R1M0_9MAGN|nr:hypothetical protein NE237_010489 [Protea cynaroides]
MPTDDMIPRKQITLSSRCHVCLKNLETFDHIFTNCEVAEKKRNAGEGWSICILGAMDHTITPLTAGASNTYRVTFNWDETIGIPGAFIIKNMHHSQFYLKTVTLEDVPGIGHPNTESRIPLAMILDVYVPRDERFGHLKMSDFLAYALKAVVQFLLPELTAYCDITPKEFTTFQDVLNLYEGGIQLPNGPRFDKVKDAIPWDLLKELVRSDGERLLKFPMPQVINGMH